MSHQFLQAFVIFVMFNHYVTRNKDFIILKKNILVEKLLVLQSYSIQALWKCCSLN